MKKLALVLVTFCMTMLACQNESPKLVPFKEVPPTAEKLDLAKEGIVTQLDVLFIVDDSGSMSNHQRNLANNIDLFTQEFTKSSFVDYHIGVITTTFKYCSGSVACAGALVGGVNKWVERNTPSGISVLKNNILVGTGGDSQEMFFSPLIAALTPPLVDGANKGFYRQRAHLAIIILTDTEDQSERVSASDAVNFLKQLKPSGKDFSVYAAYVDGKNRSCPGDDPQRGRLQEFFTKTNAVTFDLCDPQFGKKLADVGKDIFRRIARMMYLSRVPDPTSIVVRYGKSILPRDLKKGWTFDPARNALLFGDEINWDSQPPGSNLDVDYTPAR